MEKGRNAQYAAATGILAVILIMVGFFTAFASDLPKLDDPVRDWGTFFTDHQDRVQFGLMLVGVGMFFYIWFLGSLRDAIAAAEGGTGRLASIAYGGGLLSVAFFFIAITGGLAAAFHPDEVDPNTTRALNDIGVLVAAPASAAFTAMFAASAIAGYRHGAFPAPIAGFAALAAIGQPFAFVVGLTDSGVFAADGAIGFFIPLVTFVLAMLALSGSLYRQAGEGATTGAAAP